MRKVCKKHIENPVLVYSPCVACDLEWLHNRNDELEKQNKHYREELRKAEQYISNGFEFGYIDEREGQTDTLLTSINKVLRKYGFNVKE